MKLIVKGQGAMGTLAQTNMRVRGWRVVCYNSGGGTVQRGHDVHFGKERTTRCGSGNRIG